MANKRFIKPIRPIVPKVLSVSEQLDAWRKAEANRAKACRDEYRYCLAEAKRHYPSWSLAQRQEYARNAVQSLFD